MTIARIPAAFAIRASSSASSLRGVPSGAACAGMSMAPSSVWARPTTNGARAQHANTANDTARITSLTPRLRASIALRLGYVGDAGARCEQACETDAGDDDDDDGTTRCGDRIYACGARRPVSCAGA